MKLQSSLVRVLAACLAVALSPAQAANVLVTPGGVAGYLYLTPADSASGSASTDAAAVDCTAAFVSNYTKTFVAGDVTKDIVVNYWMKGAGGGGGYGPGGNGAAVSSSFTIPSGYVGTLKLWVGRGGGVGGAYSSYTAGGKGGDGYAAGGGGGVGEMNCANCVYGSYGGGGGGSSAIVLGTGVQAIAGGGGGGGGVFGQAGTPVGGNGVGASGGGGGGSRAGTNGADIKGGIWNGVAPASTGGSGTTTMYFKALAASLSACEADLSAEQAGGGFGGTNGGGGGGGGGGHYTWVTATSTCAWTMGGGGGGGGGAGGGGGGGGANAVSHTTLAQIGGAAGGANGAAGLAAPDLYDADARRVGGVGGSFNATSGGTEPGHDYATLTVFGLTQGDAGTYGTDPYIFLQDKGVGGAQAYWNGTIVVSPAAGTSGGVFFKYAAPSCVMQPAL